MTSLNAAARRLLVLCDLIPLPELTQDDVDFRFRRLIEDAPPEEGGGPSTRVSAPESAVAP
jgi:hypothetical protein